MSWKGSSKGGAASFLQKAMEGAVVSALGLGQFNQPKGKGKARQGQVDKNGAAKTPPSHPRTCKWEDCRAGRGKASTWGDGPNCFCCKRAFSQQPPVESMAEWAFNALVQAKEPAADKSAGKGKGKGKGTGKNVGQANANPPAPPAADKDALALLRKSRLEQLKNPSVLPDPPHQTPVAPLAPPLTAKQEQAKVLEKTLPDLLQLPAEVMEKVKTITQNGAAGIKTFLEEKYPQRSELETPEATVQRLMSGIAACASVGDREVAEKALKSTCHCLTVMKEAGTAETDPDFIIMQSRKTRQEKEAAKMKAKAPSAKLRKLSLLEAQDAYQKLVQSQKEFAQKGKEKAEARQAEREEQINEMIDALTDLRYEMDEEFSSASNLHRRRAEEKASAAKLVDEMLAERVKAIDQEISDEETVPDPSLDIVFEDAQEELPAEATQTERALEAAVASSIVHQKEAQATAASMKDQIATLQKLLEEQQQKEDAAERKALKEQQEIQEQSNAVARHAAAAAAKAERDAAAAVADAAVQVAAAKETAAKIEAQAAAFEVISYAADPDLLKNIDVEHLKENNPDALVATGDLFFTLHRWRQMGAAVPFTFHDLIQHTKAAADAPRIVQEILGEQWSLWFGENPDPAVVLPRQSVLTLLASLEKAKDQYENAEKAKEEAKQIFDRLLDASKKRRIG